MARNRGHPGTVAFKELWSPPRLSNCLVVLASLLLLAMGVAGCPAAAPITATGALTPLGSPTPGLAAGPGTTLGVPHSTPTLPSGPVASPTLAIGTASPAPVLPTVTPSLLAAPSPTPVALAGPTLTAGPTVAPSPKPGAAASTPGTPSPFNPAPDKINSNVLYLMEVRQTPAARNLAGIKEALDFMDSRGGAVVSIWFDRVLGDDEIRLLETRFGIKFDRLNGRVPRPNTPDLAAYAAVVPWDQLVTIAGLPYVRYITTYLWPPPLHFGK